MTTRYQTEEITKQYKQKLKEDFLPILENATEALEHRNSEVITSVATNLSKFLEDNGDSNISAVYVIVMHLSQTFEKLYNSPCDAGTFNLATSELKNAIALTKDLTD